MSGAAELLVGVELEEAEVTSAWIWGGKAKVYYSRFWSRLDGSFAYGALQALFCEMEIVWLVGNCIWLSQCVSGLFVFMDVCGSIVRMS